MIEFRIFQLPADPELIEIRFMSFELMAAQGRKIDPHNYIQVYWSQMEETGRATVTMLEDLFTMFNVASPEDFRGHSLSVSDVVQLGNRFFYCDSFGWREIDFA